MQNAKLGGTISGEDRGCRRAIGLRMVIEIPIGWEGNPRNMQAISALLGAGCGPSHNQRQAICHITRLQYGYACVV